MKTYSLLMMGKWVNCVFLVLAWQGVMSIGLRLQPKNLYNIRSIIDAYTERGIKPLLVQAVISNLREGWMIR